MSEIRENFCSVYEPRVINEMKRWSVSTNKFLFFLHLLEYWNARYSTFRVQFVDHSLSHRAIISKISEIARLKANV